MNWTGGTLSRHAHSKTNTQAIQRQKFARNNLLRRDFVKEGPAKVSFSATWMGRKPDNSKINTGKAGGGRNGHGDQRSTHTSAARHASGTSSRKRPRSESLSVEANPAKSEPAMNRTAAYISLKRQELLKRSDWLNLDSQGNVGVKFNTARENQDVGKRRRVHRDQRRQFRERLVQAPHTVEYKERDVHGNLLRRRHETQICIGNHILTPSIRSSVLQTSPAVTRLLSIASRSSHDVMLLDQDEGGIQSSGNDLLPAIHSSSYDAMLLDEFEEFDEHSSQDEDQNTRPLEENCVLRHNQSRRKNAGHSDTSLNSIINEHYGGHDQPRVVTSTSDILQPTPCTFRIAQILKSSSLYGDTDLESNHSRSDDNCTTAAQIGRLERTPQSQRLDDEVWRSWLDIQNAPEGIEEEEEEEEEEDITPGISEMGDAIHGSSPDVKDVDVPNPSEAFKHSVRNFIEKEEPGFKRRNKIWDRFNKMMSDLDEKFGPLNQDPDVTDDAQDCLKIFERDTAVDEIMPGDWGITERVPHHANLSTDEPKVNLPVSQELQQLSTRSRQLGSPEPWVKFTFDNNLSDSSPSQLLEPLYIPSSLRAHDSTSAEETPRSLKLNSDSLPTSQWSLDQNGSTLQGHQSIQATQVSTPAPMGNARDRLKSKSRCPKPFQPLDAMTSSPDPLSLGHYKVNQKRKGRIVRHV